MQRETLQICAVILPAQTSESQITPVTGKRDDGRDGRRGEEAEINEAKARPVRGR